MAALDLRATAWRDVSVVVEGGRTRRLPQEVCDQQGVTVIIWRPADEQDPQRYEVNEGAYSGTTHCIERALDKIERERLFAANPNDFSILTTLQLDPGWPRHCSEPWPD